MTLSNNPYIIIAQQYWFDDLGSNARNMAMEISKTQKVLYINPPLDVNTIVRHSRKRQVRNRCKALVNKTGIAQQVAENIWVHTPSSVLVSINWVRSNKLFDVINQANAFSFFKSIKKALAQLKWSAGDCIVLNDSQMFAGVHINRFLKPAKNFYYIRDNLVEHPYFKRHGSRIEPLTIQHADAVFANSAYLADYAKQYNANSNDIGQGCDLEMYDPNARLPEPADIAGIPHPRIGYTGFLTGERLDIPLLEDLAEKKKTGIGY